MVEKVVSTNQKPTMYRNLYENIDPDQFANTAPLHIFCDGEGDGNPVNAKHLYNEDVGPTLYN